MITGHGAVVVLYSWKGSHRSGITVAMHYRLYGSLRSVFFFLLDKALWAGAVAAQCWYVVTFWSDADYVDCLWSPNFWFIMSIYHIMFCLAWLLCTGLISCHEIWSLFNVFAGQRYIFTTRVIHTPFWNYAVFYSWMCLVSNCTYCALVTYAYTVTNSF